MNNITIKCPVCREPNNLVMFNTNNSTINSKCIICFERNANVAMSICKHDIFCDECCINTSLNNVTNNINTNNNELPIPSEMVDQIFGNNDWIYNFNFDGTETYIIKGAQQIFDKTKILFFILLLFPIYKKFFLDSCSMELFDCFEITILFAKHSSLACIIF